MKFRSIFPVYLSFLILWAAKPAISAISASSAISAISAISATPTFPAKPTTIPPDEPVHWDLEHYRPQPGLTASIDHNVLTVQWDGDPGEEGRIRFAVDRGTPVIRELAVRKEQGPWQVLAKGVIPEFRVVSGVRRVTQQQTEPLEELEVELTAELLDSIKWDAFWDAPLYISDEPPLSHQSSIPAEEPFANHPGMPRKQEEVTRATAGYQIENCAIRTNGARIEVVFQGVTAGIFEGYLQFDIYRGSNLIRQTLIAKTSHPSAAFKYDAGWSGLPVAPASTLQWRDLGGNLQEYLLGGPVQESPAAVKSRNRLITAGLERGSLSFFPPPHSFYWARETEENLGYSWYRKDSEQTFSAGIRQAETEENPEFYHNFALYSARPGTWQKMPVFIYLSTGAASEAREGALAFTRGDRFKPLPGYKIMGHHYHVGLVKRLKEKGGFDQQLNDMETMRSTGVDIFSIIDGVRGPARHDRGEAYLDALDEYYRAARSQSDKGFLVLANDENSTGGRPPFLGGHYDLLFSRPVYWRPQRKPGQPVIESHPEYGTVYNLGTASDMMIMTEHAGALVSLPHPHTKRSTGYPFAIRDSAHFLHENYFSLGYRWGMGIDASESRLGEYRFLRLWDQTNNWMAARNRPPKYALAISEVRTDKGRRGRPPYDDAYGMSPVNYLKLDRMPTHDDYSRVVEVLKKGDYFVTSGEVLIPHFEITGEGADRTVVAEVEWTFPLEFVEVVWGDGNTTGRQIISATGLPPFGSKRFEIPFDARHKIWVRFAAWDVGTNGAMVQPVDLRSEK